MSDYILKIKDNVDLQILEETFGFVLKKDDKGLVPFNVYEKQTFLGEIHIYPDKTYIDDYERQILFHTNYQSFYYPTNTDALIILFDLIQAGIVEKIKMKGDEK